LSPLLMFVSEGQGAPTQGMREVHAEMRRELAQHESQYRQIVGTDVPALNERAARTGVAFVTPPER
jgi:hypothetical protein